MIRVCPHSDSKCPHGMGCTFSCATADYDGTKKPTVPSNANTSGLDYFGYRVFNAGFGVCWLVANPGPSDTNPEPLVTAASAQARIAELEAERARLGRVLMTMQEAIPTAYHPNGAGLRLLINHLKESATAAEARADRAEARIAEIATMFGVCDGGRYLNDWKARLAALQAGDTAVSNEAPNDALRLVPVEPTEAMLKAAFAAMNATPSGEWKRLKAENKTPRVIFDAKMRPRWSAMLSAAPASPLPGGGSYERWSILNHLGESWTPENFNTERQATAYLDGWKRDNPKMDLSRHRVIPVLVTMTAAPTGDA